ncbi:MAG: outer membrane lipoprotein-sorting protein [Gammaproteobacteria bacterium]|nr:MAG: outer membrane lipoprotein-sorting protein [Gammaproteobacteria bacterium]
MNNLMFHSKQLPVLMVLLGFSLFANAEDFTDVNFIVRFANLASYYAGDDGQAKVRMTIVDKNGKKQRRQFNMVRKDVNEGGDQNFLIKFTKPADVRDTVFMVAKHIGKDDDRWLYLPSIDLVKRIAAGDKRTSFIGSHFFYEDVSGRGLDEDEHKLIDTTDKEYIVENTPKQPESVEFASYKLWIDKVTFIPNKIEYYNKVGKLYRSVETVKLENIQGFQTVVRSKISDIQTGGYTLMEFKGVKYNAGVPADIFTERSLRNPPRKWLGK